MRMFNQPWNEQYEPVCSNIQRFTGWSQMTKFLRKLNK